MIKMNKKMQKILDVKFCNNFSDDELIRKFCCKIVKSTKKINDCIISDEKGNHDKFDFKLIKETYFDLTEFEVTCNEFIIPDDLLTNISIIDIMRTFESELQKKYINTKFCIIIYNDDKLVLRFHTYKDDEGLWVSEDLEKYDNPIMYDIFG